MKLRLAFPTLLVDLRRVDGLRGVERSNGGWKIGAMTRHADLQDRRRARPAAVAARSIADQQVRNRGTIGGSLAHGDPASDLPAVLLAAEGSVTVQGSGGSARSPPPTCSRTTSRRRSQPDEVMTSVSLPIGDGWGFGYQKFNRRIEDWAMVGVCALVRKAADGSCEDVRVGLTNMGSTPLRATATEQALRGGASTAPASWPRRSRRRRAPNPPSDLNASSDYKRHLAQVLTARALEAAAA